MSKIVTPEIEAAIQYVVNEQGLPMAVFENKNRTFKKSNIQHGYLTFPLPNGHGSDFLRIYWAFKCNRRDVGGGAIVNTPYFL